MRRRFLLAIFVVSGFTGLIYESIWSHYLKLFLGHAAYAQTLVLAIFMGGMALGSWAVAHYSLRIRQLLWAYVLVEGLIGILGLFFHETFVAAVNFSFASVIPALSGAFSIQVYKWSLAALLILPQSVLLGMTFPLISGGLIRRWPDQPGKTLATLYFTNSLGAAIGVLVSGFVLIGAVGLPGTIRTAGLLNIVLAVAIWSIVRGRTEPPAATFVRVRTVRGAGPVDEMVHGRGIADRYGVIHVRTGLDPNAESGPRQLDAFVRADAERVHLRSGIRRTVCTAAHRANPRSGGLCGPGHGCSREPWPR